MPPANPFDNLNNLPDRTVTAVGAVVFWLAIAAVLLWFAPGPVSWVLALALSIHAARTWQRFHRRV